MQHGWSFAPAQADDLCFVAEMGADGKEQDVLATMRTNVLDGSVQELGCRSLAELQLGELGTDGDRLVKTGVANHLLVAMRVHGDNAKVLEQAFEAVANLAGSGSIMKRHIVGLGIPVDIVKAMKAHSDAGVQTSAFRALGCLADDASLGALATHGLSDAIVQAVRAHASEATWTPVIEGLVNLTSVPAIRTEVVRLGLAPMVLKAVKAKGADPYFVEMACWTLANLVADDFFEASDPRLTTLAGAAALKALKTHATATKVQAAACSVLAHLCYSEDPTTTKAKSATTEVLLKLGAAQLVVDTLRAHCATGSGGPSDGNNNNKGSNNKSNNNNNNNNNKSDNSNTTKSDNSNTTAKSKCETACQEAVRALASIASHREFITQLAFASKDIEATMAAHPSNTLLVSAGCHVVGHLANVGGASVGPESLLAAMPYHPKCEEVTFAACSALERFSVTVEGQERLMSAHAGQCLLKVMRSNKASVFVQKSACNCLANMCVKGTDAFKAHLLRLGATPVILRAMEEHADDALMQNKACSFFARVTSVFTMVGEIPSSLPYDPELLLEAEAASLSAAAGRESAIVQLSNLGAGQAVVRALLRHKDDAGVAAAGCEALTNLVAGGPSVLPRADEAITGVLQTHFSVRAQHTACGALCALVSPEDRAAQALLMEKGAGKALVGVLRAQLAATQPALVVLWQACRALCHMASSNPDTQAQLVQLGAAQDVFNVLRATLEVSLLSDAFKFRSATEDNAWGALDMIGSAQRDGPPLLDKDQVADFLQGENMTVTHDGEPAATAEKANLLRKLAGFPPD